MFQRQATKLLLLQPKIFLLAAVWICLIREMHHVILTEQLKDEG
jgi:hypothetical protein